MTLIMCNAHELTMVNCGNAASHQVQWRQPRSKRTLDLDVCSECKEKLERSEGELLRDTPNGAPTPATLLNALSLGRACLDEFMGDQVKLRATAERLLFEVVQDWLAGRSVLAKLTEAQDREIDLTGDCEASSFVSKALGLDDALGHYIEDRCQEAFALETHARRRG